VVRAPRPTLGYAATIAAGALFGLNGTVSTLALDAGLPPARLTALRCLGAAVGLLAVLAVVSPRRLRLRARDIPLLALFGVIGVAGSQFLYYVAIGRLPIGIALVFEMTAPVFIALYVRLVRRERVRRTLWVALVLSLAGLALVAEIWNGGGSLDPLGVAAGLCAALCLAVYYLLGQRGTATRDPVTLTFWGFLAAGLFWSVAAPWWNFHAGILATQVPLPVGALHLPLWALVLWIVVLGAIVPFWLSIAALPHLSPTTAGIVATVEPLFAAAIAWPLLGQVLSGWQIAGGVVVLAGIALAQLARAPAATDAVLERGKVPVLFPAQVPRGGSRRR
jgi:drug/metabolite transporter (DMT)-like permease